jgi:hypothetical protein
MKTEDCPTLLLLSLTLIVHTVLSLSLTLIYIDLGICAKHVCHLSLNILRQTALLSPAHLSVLLCPAPHTCLYCSVQPRTLVCTALSRPAHLSVLLCPAPHTCLYCSVQPHTLVCTASVAAYLLAVCGHLPRKYIIYITGLG